jgi:hypothetical protein
MERPEKGALFFWVSISEAHTARRTGTVYGDRRELKCACVGGASNVPLAFASLTETDDDRHGGVDGARGLRPAAGVGARDVARSPPSRSAARSSVGSPDPGPSHCVELQTLCAGLKDSACEAADRPSRDAGDLVRSVSHWVIWTAGLENR